MLGKRRASFQADASIPVAHSAEGHVVGQGEIVGVYERPAPETPRN
ncbi:hypothetical protein [Pelagibacterium sp. H642]|nr:hypothetical protein [Pelagibacterium sp. H642]WMT92787.1 hypothetical protein NO934_18565 [Pelagibacterium sp. H642]